MEVSTLPDFFEKCCERMVTLDNTASVVHYVQRREVEKVRVKLNTNLIVLIRSGSKDVHHHSGSLSVPPGEGFFIKKGHYLMSEKTQGEVPYESLLLFFNDEFVTRYGRTLFTGTQGNTAGRRTGEAPSNMMRIGEDARINEFARSLKQYFPLKESKAALSSVLTIKLQEILQLLILSESTPGFAEFFHKLNDPVANNLRNLMETNFRENLSLEQLAFLSACSLSTFKRRVEETFGQSPGKWIQGRRLQEAYTLLATTSYSVTEIGYTCGFETPSHFIQSFRSRFGDTPAHCRQELMAI